MVSLRVDSERAKLEGVETRIVLAQRDMRVLQTEIGTRGRLSQLERWNAGAFALGAPSADQFLKGGFELARLARPDHKVDFQAPVVLASAPAPTKSPVVGQPETDDGETLAAAVTPSSLLHQASLKTETREVPARPIVALPQTMARSTEKPATSAKPAQSTTAAKPGLATAQSKAPLRARISAKKSVDKPAVVTAPT